MSTSLIQSQDFQSVLAQIQQTRTRIFAQVSASLIDLNWHIGQTISQRVQSAGWGKGVVSELARFVAHKDPSTKGFSDKNLWRMKQFYETYQDDEKLSPLVRELPWMHNAIIFSRCKTADERKYYLRQCQTEQFTKRDLKRQIDAFKPEHLGQLSFYLEALDRDVKKSQENPSIGVLLCRDKDDGVVEYALSRNLSPALIAEYHMQLLDKKLLQARLRKISAHVEVANEE